MDKEIGKGCANIIAVILIQYVVVAFMMSDPFNTSDEGFGVVDREVESGEVAPSDAKTEKILSFGVILFISTLVFACFSPLFLINVPISIGLVIGSLVALDTYPAKGIFWGIVAGLIVFGWIGQFLLAFARSKG
jgi:xanthine/uracil permease